MKKNPNRLLLMKAAMMFCIMTLFVACDKDDDKCQGIDCLPPATQIGAGTFGCLVNGVPFVDNSNDFNCFYQLVNGEYYFSISATFNKTIRGIGIGSQGIELIQGSSYNLIEINSGNFSADVYINANNNFETTSVSPGNITISKFDLQNNIVSATFEFTVVDPVTGTIYEITEGRFDSRFGS
jgi:hypothetical protein